MVFSDNSYYARKAFVDGGDRGESEDEFALDGSQQRGRRRVHFTLEELKQYFHLPLKVAAQELGVCEAALKRICRRNRIKKWPFRKLQSVMRRIDDAIRSEDAHRHSFISISDSRSNMCDFLLPHELEERRKDHPAQPEDTDALSRKLQMLEEEKQFIIETAQETRQSELYASASMGDSYELSSSLDLLATLCVSSCSKATPRTETALPRTDYEYSSEMDITPVKILRLMTETA